MATRPATLSRRVTDAGDYDQLITFERPTEDSINDYGEPVPGAHQQIATAWAEVLWGTGQERREAAQERVAKTATFICDWNATLATVVETDHIVHISGTYDITDVSPKGHQKIHFTGARLV